MSGRGREAIQKGRERSGGPPGVTGVMRMDGRGCESPSECREGSGVSSG